MAWTHDRERFPPKQYELIGPGKYREKATGRVYVDSHDMDDALDETLDQANLAHERNDRERAQAVKDGRMPPPHVEAQAEEWETRHRERLERMAEQNALAIEAESAAGQARARLDTLAKIEAYRKSQGLSVPEYVATERAELEHTLEVLGRLGGEDGSTDPGADAGPPV